MTTAIRRHIPTILAACFAMAWVILRANVQSITLDEADSYLGGVLEDWPSHWYPTSGNHVLNTILMRLLTWIFGMAHLTVRGPALLGAAIYIIASYRICRLITSDWRLVLPAFICFVYNPFVMDYMVAARGYSLAFGFLMTAWFLVLREILQPVPERLLRTVGLTSTCVALSFSANFAFAYVDFLSLFLFASWKAREVFKQGGWRPTLRLLAAAVGPGLLVSLLLVASVVLAWPKGQLYFGSASVSEMWRSLIGSTFYELNEVLVNPLLMKLLRGIQPWLPHLVWAGCVLQFALKRREGRHFDAALYATALLLLTLLCHWLQFKLFRVPLPKERTGIFLVVLAFLVFVLTTAMPASTRTSSAVRVGAMGILALTGVYFVGCLRVVTFHEWWFGVDVRAAFPVVQQISRQQGIRDFPTAWHYASSLEFYRRMYHDDTIRPFRFTEPPPDGQQAYILPYHDFENFIRTQRLTIVYRGTFTDLIIAVRKPTPSLR